MRMRLRKWVANSPELLEAITDDIDKRPNDTLRDKRSATGHKAVKKRSPAPPRPTPNYVLHARACTLTNLKTNTVYSMGLLSCVIMVGEKYC